MNDPLVSVEWLAAHLDDVVVLDATYYMPPDPARSRADFNAERVPGARLFEIDAVADASAELPHMLPDEAGFARAMSELGIDGSKPVVVYDRSPDHFSAPRVWFTLRLFGLAESYVLDGGLRAWVGAGQPVESGAAEPVSEVPPVAWSLDRARVLSGLDMQGVVAAGGTTIVDARAQARFDGVAPEPRAGLSSGHMPGAHCVPYVTLTGEDGFFADAETIGQAFAVEPGESPVLTCGSGMTACVLALALTRIGVAPRLYDGSWADWGRGTLGPIHVTAQ